MKRKKNNVIASSRINTSLPAGRQDEAIPSTTTLQRSPLSSPDLSGSGLKNRGRRIRGLQPFRSRNGGEKFETPWFLFFATALFSLIPLVAILKKVFSGGVALWNDP